MLPPPPTKGFASIPGRELVHWLPCFFELAVSRDVASSTTPAVDERGKLIPHCYFVTSNVDPHVRCPDCRRRQGSK